MENYPEKGSLFPNPNSYASLHTDKNGLLVAIQYSDESHVETVCSWEVKYGNLGGRIKCEPMQRLSKEELVAAIEKILPPPFKVAGVIDETKSKYSDSMHLRLSNAGVSFDVKQGGSGALVTINFGAWGSVNSKMKMSMTNKALRQLSDFFSRAAKETFAEGYCALEDTLPDE